MYTFLLVVQVVICAVLVALVLVQKGQGADIGAVFGGGASQTLFGARGAGNFLSHVTAAVAAIFFLNSLTLAYLSEHEASRAGSGIALPAAGPVTVPSSTASTASTVAPAASASAALASVRPQAAGANSAGPAGGPQTP